MFSVPMQEIPFETARFDLITSVEVFEHIPEAGGGVRSSAPPTLNHTLLLRVPGGCSEQALDRR